MSTRYRTPTRPRPDDSCPRGARAAWYRQTIVWLGVAVLVASVAGCIWLVVVAERYDDPPLPVEGLHILKVPLTRPAPQTPRPSR